MVVRPNIWSRAESILSKTRKLFFLVECKHKGFEYGMRVTERANSSRIRERLFLGALQMDNSLSVHSTVVATKGQISSDLGDEVAILDLEGGMYYGLDNAGARVWELIQEPRKVEDVYTTIVKEYDVEPERCERDVVSLIQKLRDEGLAEVLDEGNA